MARTHKCTQRDPSTEPATGTFTTLNREASADGADAAEQR